MRRAADMVESARACEGTALWFHAHYTGRKRGLRPDSARASMRANVAAANQYWLRAAIALLLFALLAACGAPCEPPTGLLVVSDTCPTIALDTCAPGPLDGAYDASCVVTVDLVCGPVTVGGQVGGALWDDAGCGYRWAP